MKELYVCFTPYHMLLCSCIASDREDDIDKEMIIIEDFLEADRIIEVLKRWKENPFDDHIMVKGKFSVDEIPEKSILNVLKDDSVVNVLKEGIDTLKDRYGDVPLHTVFTCNDERPQSQFLEYRCKKNGGLNVYVEDGSELYNDSFEEPLPFHESVFYKMYYGRWYEKIRLIGDYRYTDEIRALRPDLVRDELKHKKIKPIGLKNFIGLKKSGLTESMIKKFKVKIDLDEDYVILFLPHSEFIKKRKQESIYNEMVEELQKNNKKILLKYHPRENDHYIMQHGENITILPQSLPSEILILQMIDNPPLVIGDISTCLLTSKFLDEKIKVISLIDILNMDSSNLRRVFEKIGVMMPESHNQLKGMLDNV